MLGYFYGTVTPSLGSRCALTCDAVTCCNVGNGKLYFEGFRWSHCNNKTHLLTLLNQYLTDLKSLFKSVSNLQTVSEVWAADEPAAPSLHLRLLTLASTEVKVTRAPRREDRSVVWSRGLPPQTVFLWVLTLRTYLSRCLCTCMFYMCCIFAEVSLRCVCCQAAAVGRSSVCVQLQHFLPCFSFSTSRSSSSVRNGFLLLVSALLIIHTCFPALLFVLMCEGRIQKLK